MIGTIFILFNTCKNNLYMLVDSPLIYKCFFCFPSAVRDCHRNAIYSYCSTSFMKSVVNKKN